MNKRWGSRGLVRTLAFLGVVAYAMPVAVMTPALPVVQAELGASAAGAAWSITAITLSAAVATPVIGRLGDLFGALRVMRWVLPLALVGQAVTALAPNLPVLLAGRALAGVGSGVFPLAYTLIRAHGKERAISGLGVMSSMLALGGAAAWVVAGPVIDLAGWRWLVAVPATLLLVGTFLARRLPETDGSPGQRVDWWGAVLFAGWMGAGLTGLTQGLSWGWTSPGVLALAGAAVALCGVWVRVEARVPQPLMDPRMLRLRGVWTANLGSIIAGFCLMAAGVLMPLLVQAPERDGFGFGGTATDTALVALPASIAMTASGMLAALLARGIGARAVLAAGGVLTAASYAMMLALHAELWQLMAANAVRGAGLGLAYAAVATLVVAAVPMAQTGVATGVNTLLRTVGAGLGTQATAVMVAAFAGARQGFLLAFGSCAVLALGVVAAAVLAPRPAKAASPETGRLPEPAS
ncbi:MFS transporter [Actinocorallia sp. A-T 12471]|uniref:MFS transporter n=1 Tax=Actinocorallia sp. A-T 12471 TaxID=3089813 RepID=UPI0029CFA47E|nr:MFS transporter [Actinocorallia sp. A-T 12471]MDX6743146.1 MFS transporter [Actinocorallia sp. A-T 12471]